MKKIIFGTFMFLSISSCADVLDLSPLNSISETVTWSDPEMVKLYVNARYNELPHGFQQFTGGLRMTGITDESYHMHETRCDKYLAGGITSDNMFFYGGFWHEAYQAISNNNNFLEKFDASIGESKLMAQYSAEIRWLRAWFYTELMSRYGAVPLITKTFNPNDNFNVERSSVKDITDFVVKEIDEILPDLLSRSDATGDNFGRITQGAALALKVRALMFYASPLFNSDNEKSRWQNVALACEELFNLNEYELSSDYQNLFLNANDSEVIFFKQFIDEYGGESYSMSGDSYFHYRGGHRIDEWRFPSGSGGWVSENPIQTMVDQCETLKGEIPVLGYEGDESNLTPILNPNASDYDPDHPYEDRDPRLKMSIYYDGNEWKGREIEMWDGGADSRNTNVNWWWNGSKLSYGILKSLNPDWDYTSTVGSEQPWIYMRLSEFYLTYAEAQYHLGNEQLANEYVNKIRQREGVNMPSIAASGVELLNKIKHERRVELAFEGNRFYDARRWRDAEKDFSQDVIGVEIKRNAVTGEKSYRYYVFLTRDYDPKNDLWPIPVEEIKKSNLEQNPGY